MIMEYYTPEQKKAEIKKFKRKIELLRITIDNLRLFGDVISRYDGKKIFKREIDICNKYLTHEAHIELSLRTSSKRTWGDNYFRLHLPDSLVRDKSGERIIGGVVVIYPGDTDFYDKEQYIEDDRVLNSDELIESIEKAVQLIEKQINDAERTISEYNLWSKKCNQIIKLYSELKQDAPDFFKYGFKFRQY